MMTRAHDLNNIRIFVLTYKQKNPNNTKDENKIRPMLEAT